MSLSKEAIQKANAPVSINIESLGGEVLMKRMTVKQKMDWITSFKDDPEALRLAGVSLIAMSVLNDDGSPMFTNDEVLQLDSVCTDEIAAAISDLNKMGPKAVKDAEKN